MNYSKMLKLFNQHFKDTNSLLKVEIACEIGKIVKLTNEFYEKICNKTYNIIVNQINGDINACNVKDAIIDLIENEGFSLTQIVEMENDKLADISYEWK